MVNTEKRVNVNIITVVVWSLFYTYVHMFFITRRIMVCNLCCQNIDNFLNARQEYEIKKNLLNINLNTCTTAIS